MDSAKGAGDMRPQARNKAKVKCRRKPTFDILMGVGERYYPDPSFFIEEVLRLGLSKRLPDIPEYWDCKENALWLVHWKTRKIFGLVVNVKIRIVAPPNSVVCKAAKEKYGEECVICADLGSLPGDGALRGCGRLRADGKYAKQI